MTARPFSIILLPTLRCNADCAYCFENKGCQDLTLAQLEVVVHKLLEYVGQSRFDSAEINWQGGEALLMGLDWFKAAQEIVARASDQHGVPVVNGLQSNLLLYNERWLPVVAEMFGNSIGTSFDYPNLHRTVAGKTEPYERIWLRKLAAARQAGIHIGAIAVPSRQTLELGAERFYARFVDELGLSDFQVNTPFAGGPPSLVKRDYPLDPERLGRFLVDLADIWIERGLERGVTIGPLDALLQRFLQQPATLPCIWHASCASEFVCIAPDGWVSLCDCWASSFPEHRFGNIFDDVSLAVLLERSPARRELQSRPGEIMRQEDCLECDFLNLCHGGCPIRTFTLRGKLAAKDPYCATYKLVFEHMRAWARRLSRGTSPDMGPPRATSAQLSTARHR